MHTSRQDFRDAGRDLDMDLATAKGGTLRVKRRASSFREVCLIGGSEAEGIGDDLRRAGRRYRVASRIRTQAGVSYLRLEPASDRN